MTCQQRVGRIWGCAGYIGLESCNKKAPQIGRRCAGQLFFAGKHNANPLNIFVHFQLLWLHNTHQFKVLLHLPGRNSNLKLCPPPIRSPVWESGWTYRWSKMVLIEMSSAYNSASIHTIYSLSCTVWPQYTTWNWQTDERQADIIRIGRLWC